MSELCVVCKNEFTSGLLKCIQKVLPHYSLNRHSRESGNPIQKHWIPGHARNDKQNKGLFLGAEEDER
jgi:hypothetical protein